MYVTQEEFKKEVYEIEEVKIDFDPLFDLRTGKEKLIPKYPYNEKAPDDWSYEELMDKRIIPLLKKAYPEYVKA